MFLCVNWCSQNSPDHRSGCDDCSNKFYWHLCKTDKGCAAFSSLIWLFLWCLTLAHVFSTLCILVNIWCSWNFQKVVTQHLITAAGVYHDNLGDIAKRWQSSGPWGCLRNTVVPSVLTKPKLCYAWAEGRSLHPFWLYVALCHLGNTMLLFLPWGNSSFTSFLLSTPRC